MSSMGLRLLAPLLLSAYPCTGNTTPYSTKIGTYSHYGEDDDYTHYPIFVAMERNYSPEVFAGIGLFNNSFGQFSQTIYAGRKFHPLAGRLNGFTVEVIAGILSGYKDEYQDNIPFNQFGVAPMILPAIGYQSPDDTWSVEVLALGLAGLLYSLQIEL